MRYTAISNFYRRVIPLLIVLRSGPLTPIPAPAQTFPAGQPQKLVVPVTVQEDGVISVNDVSYPPPTGNAGVHVVTFNRQTLDFVFDDSFDNSGDFNGYIDEILGGAGGEPSDLLVLVASIDRNVGFPLQGIAPKLEALGATNELRGLTSAHGTLSFIGHGGLRMNQAFQSGGTISGYFAQDLKKNYAFIPLDYLTYSLDPTNRAITAGNQSWTADCDDGFFLVEFDRVNPQAAKFRKCYPTGSGDETALTNLQTDLGLINSNEGNGVFLISVGSPMSASLSSEQTGTIEKIASTIRDLGGYAETFAALGPHDRYALVGFPHGRASEASTLYPGRPSGILKGALGRGPICVVQFDRRGFERGGQHRFIRHHWTARTALSPSCQRGRVERI